MKEPNILIIILIIIVILLIIKKIKNYRLNKLFKQIKTALNLQYISGSNTALKGVYENIPVEIFYKIKIIKRIKKKYIISIAKHKLNLNDSITIIHESLASTILKFVGFKDRISYNKLFDTKYYIKCNNPLYITAFLNKDITALIDNIIQKKSSLQIINNKLILTDKFKNNVHANIVTEHIKKLIAICKNFNEIENIKNRLVYNIKNETVLQIRQQNLYYLILNYNKEPDIQKLFKELLRDREVSIQINAALNLADKKYAMRSLYETLKNKKNLSDEDKLKIIKGFGEYKYKKAIPFLKKEYLTTDKHDIKINILKSMRALADKLLKSFLLEQLELCEKSDSELRIYIIKALGSCGDKECVEKLYKLSKDTFNPFVKTALTAAIDRIQSRLGKVEAGWISETKLDVNQGGLSKTNASPSKGAISKKK